MKYLIIILLASLSLTNFGQKSKFTTSTFKVYGVCGMCEERIENALDVVGIKRADWDVETKMLIVIYQEDKISVEEIHQLCADVGHSTEKIKCSREAYNALHGCCKYEDPEVIKSHK